MIGRAVLVTVLLLGAWAARVSVGEPPATTTAESLTRFPTAIGRWSGEDRPLDVDVIKTAAVDDYLNRAYRSSTGEVGLYIGYYQRQRRGEALHSPLFCLPGAGWQPIATREIALNRPGRGPTSVKELVVERGLDRLLVVYWYQTLERVTGSEYSRKFFLMKDAFVSRRTDQALVRVIAPIEGRGTAGEGQALALVRPFAERVLPEVQERLFR